jgi:hypothetical protein
MKEALDFFQYCQLLVLHGNFKNENIYFTFNDIF